MIIIKNFIESQVCSEKKTAVTLGTFDGIHIGHIEILKELMRRADKSGEIATVVTFDRHPNAVLRPDQRTGLITSLDEKVDIFENIGLGMLCVISFTKYISEMRAEEFISKYLLNCLKMNYLIVGYDHGFGKQRSGSLELLENYAGRNNFTLQIQKPVIANGMIVKSSVIREYLSQGDIESVSIFLGRDYNLRGKVVKGRGVGNKIGIPTANIDITDREKIIPKNGVYAGWAEVKGKKIDAVVSIGPTPTFSREEEILEVHLFDWDGDIYGEMVNIGFVRRIRDIIKFASGKELSGAIQNDIELSKQFISLKKGEET
jgi:riboflavin kinase/FMN adenylyltransferase